MPISAPMLRVGAVPEAVAKVGSKSPIASALSAKKWAQVPVALRERATFSAKVESVRFVREVKAAMQRSVTAAREGGVMTRERFISELRATALDEGLGATGPRRVEDVTTDTRLGLIFDMQSRQAAEYARFVGGQDPDMLDAYPAQRLQRVEDRETPRGYRKTATGLVPEPEDGWPARWKRAGESVQWQGADEGEMIALKSSPIWTALSAFGTPYPPFDYSSGMGVVDVPRSEAQRLGLIEPGERPQSALPGFNDSLSASIDPADVPQLREWFGDKIDVADGRAVWVGNTPG